MAFSFALNHLLNAEPWARARLAAFAGEALELRAPPLPPLRVTVQEAGTVAAGGAEPAVILTLKPEALAGLARGPEYALRAVEITGSGRLAAEILLLVRHLRWDYEEDLARLFGDVAAHRLGAMAREFAAWHADAARRLAAALADYATDEKRLLLGRSEIGAHSAAIAALRDAIERFEKRIEHLG